MTNICPRNSNLNQHDWKYQEEACREWTKNTTRYILLPVQSFTQRTIRLRVNAGSQCLVPFSKWFFV